MRFHSNSWSNLRASKQELGDFQKTFFKVTVNSVAEREA